LTRSGSSDPNIPADRRHNLSANEQAVLDKVHIPILKKIVTGIWYVKLRLQFTGWLQYLVPNMVMLVIFLLAALAVLLGLKTLAVIIAGMGTLLLLMNLFDLATVKLKIRFPEQLPKRNDDLDLFDLMRARRSCRSFQTRKMTQGDREELLRSVDLHSSAATFGNEKVRFEFISAPLTVWPTVNASEFLVAIAPREYNRLAVIDVGRTLQKIVMDATRMGLGTCWIGPGADHASIMKDLGDRFDPDKDHIICVCAVGYRSRYIPLFIRIFNAQFHNRLPLSSLFFTAPDFKTPLDLEADPFNRFGRNFEICQWAPSSYNGQTTRCTAGYEGMVNDLRLARFDFYTSIASRYYAPVALGIWCANWEMGCEALGIQGHFAILTEEAQGFGNDGSTLELPHYDMSWVLDEKF
jgi:nitroreductase